MMTDLIECNESTPSRFRSVKSSTAMPFEYEKLNKAKDEWNLKEKLGEGSYGQVYRVENRHTQQWVAAKIIHLTSDEHSIEIENELNVLKMISGQNENLPNFFGIFSDSDSAEVRQIWFVMELCQLGPMTRLLKKISHFNLLENVDKEKVIGYAVQSVLKALDYLHRSGIMHRDVKGSHILVTENYSIKLIDFGIAALFDDERPKRQSSVGTALWMAPEVIACAHQLDEGFDQRCDIWSLGITTIELADGEPPLNDLHPTKALLEIPRRPAPTLKTPEQWSDEFLHFISACLIKDYQNRPTAKQLLDEQKFLRLDQSQLENHRRFFQSVHQRFLLLDQQTKSIESDRSTVIYEYEDDDEVHRNPWILNISKPADLIDPENNLAFLDYFDSQTLIESLHRRFVKTLIYTLIGDVLIAINPKQFLPIDNFNFQLKYSKIRRDLFPHVFSMATNVYHQMMTTHHPQCLILSGESGSGKTHAAQNLISEFALLGFGEQKSLENRLVTMNLLLESFGNARTALNSNSSRFGKLLEMFFSDHGTINYVEISQFLLEKSRVVLPGGNQRNFHIFYSIYSHFLTEVKTGPASLVIDPTALDLLKNVSTYTYLGKLDDDDEKNFNLTLNELFSIFNELNVSVDEQTSILSILIGIIHLGNISFQSKLDENETGCLITDRSSVHLDIVQRLLKVDRQDLIDSLCQSMLVTRGETVIKFNSIAEAYQTRDAMAKSLYSRLFDWIVFALNRYFRNELEFQPKSLAEIRKQSHQDLAHDQSNSIRKSSKDRSSIAILDLFGFENFEKNSYEQLCINIANEQLQYFFRQHTFAWELKEYENEGIQTQIDCSAYQFPNNRAVLDMFLSKPIGFLALLDEESRFPQATDLTLIQKWRENLHSNYFLSAPTSNSSSQKSTRKQRNDLLDPQLSFTIFHYAGEIQYSAEDFLEKNRDYVPIEILSVLLHSDDSLVSLLFQSRLKKTGSVIYTNQQRKSSLHRTTTSNRTRGTVSTYFRYSLMELVGHMASTQPTFIRCLVPNRCATKLSHQNYDHTSYFPQNYRFDTSQFDAEIVMEQINYSGLLETIEIRRRGYSHRIFFNEFVSIYSCLLISQEFHELNNDSKVTSKKILDLFHFTDYVMGKTKIFLKFHQIDQLNYLRNTLIKKIVRLQSRIRMHLILKTVPTNLRLLMNKNENEHEHLLRLQSAVRTFLACSSVKKAVGAAVRIQSFWRMWRERSKFRRLLVEHHREQAQISNFFLQIIRIGENSRENLENLSAKHQVKPTDPTRFPPDIKIESLGKYYDEIARRRSARIERKQSTDSRRPSTAPLIPTAPPCPPAEFFQQTRPTVPTLQRNISAPVPCQNHVDELKRIFASRQIGKDVASTSSNSFVVLPSRQAPETHLSMTYLHVNNVASNDTPRRRLSSSSSIIQGKITGLSTSSTSSLLGDLVLTPTEVQKLRKNLRKTGWDHADQTLRRKLPKETVQIDFRSVLRKAKSDMNITHR